MATTDPHPPTSTKVLPFGIWPYTQPINDDHAGVQPPAQPTAHTAHPLTRGLPVGLARRLVSEYSAPGERVLEVTLPHEPALRDAIATQATTLGRCYLQHDHRWTSQSDPGHPQPWVRLVNTVGLLIILLPGRAAPGRSATRHDPVPGRGVLAAWARAAHRLLAPGGRLVVVTNTFATAAGASTCPPRSSAWSPTAD